MTEDCQGGSEVELLQVGHNDGEASVPAGSRFESGVVQRIMLRFDNVCIIMKQGERRKGHARTRQVQTVSWARTEKENDGLT